MTLGWLGIALLALAFGAWSAWALRRAGPALVVVAALGVPAASLALYLYMGAPQQPDLPLAARDEPAIQEARELNRFREVTGVLAERLRHDPENLQGWTMLTRAYRSLGEWQSAVEAWGRALALMGEEATAEDWAELALLHIQGADGRVTDGALPAIEQALAIDPNNPQARHFQALRLAQSGDLPGAVVAWRSLLDDAPPDAAWRPAIAQYLGRAEAELAAPQRGPSADDVAAAAQMSAEDRAAMVEGMVGQLAARLADEPDDPGGWLRLARAYGVLGRRDDAATALTRAEETATARLAVAPDDAAAMQAIIRSAAAMRQQL